MSGTPGGGLLEVPGAAPLRRPRVSDGPAVLDAFRSDTQMARQGTVRTVEEAHTYVKRLLDDPQAHQVWAVTDDDDRLIGLIDGKRIDVLTYVRLRSDPQPPPWQGPTAGDCQRA